MGLKFVCKLSKPFKISNGVRQGSVLTPIIFNIFFTYFGTMMYATFRVIFLKYRLKGSLFDILRLNDKIKNTRATMFEVLFVDDYALLAHLECDLQVFVSRFRLYIGLQSVSLRHMSFQCSHSGHPTEVGG